MKRIGFIGWESADIALYLARLLRMNEEGVAVVDHTRKLSLMRNAGIPEELTKTSGMYQEIEIYSAESKMKLPKDVGVVIDYFGYYTTLPQIKECDILIFVTDMVLYNAQLLKDVEAGEEAEKFLIIRDHISLKYTEKYLRVETGQNILEENTFIIPFNEGDYKSRCYLCVDKKHKLSMLSEPMRKVLLYLYSNVSKKEINRKEIRNLLSKA